MKKNLRLFLFLTCSVLFGKTSFAQYCIPEYTDGPMYGYYINRVVLNTLDYTSGLGVEYNDYTDQNTVLIAGDPYSITTYVGYYGQYLQAWIDFDQDGLFESSEALYSGTYYVYTSSTGSFNVPAGAATGVTRMRVMVSSYAWPSMDPCADAFDYYYNGEAEDYSIIIPGDDPLDIGVVSVDAPASGCGMGSETISANIFNLGTNPAAAPFDISYQVYTAATGWGTPVTETYSGTDLASLESTLYTFSTPIDYSTPADYKVRVYTTFTGDASADNDTTYAYTSSFLTVTSFPYNEDFEGGASDWFQYGSASSWELGSPSGPVISGAPPTTPSSTKSWATNLDGYYNSYEESYVESPCFDFTDLTLPFIELDIWWETYPYGDGANLQYSLDGGISWEIVGDLGTGDNWYNGTPYSLGYDPFTGMNYPGWVGSSSSWVTAHHDLAFLAGESSVKLRVKFASDWSAYYDGIAIDNIRIDQPFPDDVGVSAIISPVSSPTLTAAEYPSVMLQNYGLNSETNFYVYYQVGTGTIHSELYTGTLLPTGTDILPFSTSEDFGALGDYPIKAWTELAGDYDNTNDTSETTVSHVPPITGTGVYYVHLSTEDPYYSTDNVDNMNEIFGEDLWTEEFFDTMDPATVFGVNTCFIFLEGGGNTAVEFESFLEDNILTVQSWVASGGNLYMNCSPTEGSDIDLGFGGVSLVNLYPFSSIYSCVSTDPSFPIFTTPYSPADAYWSGLIGYGRLTGDFMPLLNDAYYTTNYVLGYKEWGEGTILFGSMHPTNTWYPASEARNMKKNMLEFMKYCSPVDLTVTALESPSVTGCALTDEEDIVITLTNVGPTTVSSVPVKYKLDTDPDVSELATAVMESGATTTYTFDAPADLSSLGVHTLKIWTDIYQDEDHTNDTLNLSITNFEAPSVDLGPDLQVCDEILLDALNPGMIYLWSTGETTQSITTTVGGDIWVAVTHPSTGCVVADTINLDLTYTPAADFSAAITGLTVNFSNLSSTGALYTWYFGDGTYSNEFSPEHVFTPNAYTVVLVAENFCGYSSFDTILYIGVTGLNDLALDTRTVLYPNPASDQVSVAMNFDQQYAVQFELINSLGQILLTENAGEIKQSTYKLDVSSVPAGTYQLRISADGYKYVKPVVITK